MAYLTVQRSHEFEAKNKTQSIDHFSLHSSYLKTHVQLKKNQLRYKIFDSIERDNFTYHAISLIQNQIPLQKERKMNLLTKKKQTIIYRTFANPTRPRCIKSFRRPGVATNTWAPFSKSRD
jgi:hypothetical protein